MRLNGMRQTAPAIATSDDGKPVDWRHFKRDFYKGLETLSGLRIVFALWMLVCATPVAAQEDYQSLWQRGAYREAVQALEGRLERMPFRPRALRSDYAELLFAVGRVDEAIEELERAVTGTFAPQTTIRLAEMYRYRGRLQSFAGALRIAERQLEMIASLLPDRDDRLAAGRLMELRGEDPRAILQHYALMGDEIPALVAAGRLALSKRAFDLSARKFGQVLALNDGHQEALAGLARCYYLSGDMRVGEVMERLLYINPHHPEAHVLKAEQLLDRGDAEAALAVLDGVLAINPNHLSAMALVAAGHFLNDDADAMAQAQARAQAFNPHDSGIYRVVGRVASRHYRFEEGRAFQAQALVVDDNDVDARLLLALDLLRLGKDAVARGELERVFAVDPFSVRAYNLLEAADAIDAFHTVERDIFRLQMPALEAAVLGEEMLALLSEAAAHYQEVYDVDLHVPVVVQVFDDHDVFMVRSVGLPGNAGHLGICFGRLVTMDSPRARPPGAMNWAQVLWHEFVHVITLQKTNNRMPRWLSEGISVYEETRRDPAWGQKLLPQFKAVVDADGFPMASGLEALFATPRSPMHLMFGYFAAGEFVIWYVDAFGMDALVQALAQIGQGALALNALAERAGESLRKLDARFQAHLMARCAPLAQVREGSAFRTALRSGAEAAQAGDVEKADAAFRRALVLYPDYAGEDAPLRQLAALYAGRDTAQYAAVLAQRVMAEPTAFDACVQLGRLRLAQGDLNEAVHAMNRAFAIHPFHAEMLSLRAQALMALGDFDGAIADLRRLMAVDATGKPDYRLQLARALFRKGARDAARTEVLSLLEGLPHFWEAQALLLEIVE